MKLTGALKEKVEKAESAEGAKELIEEAGFDLTDDEIESVVGGFSFSDIIKPITDKAKEIEKRPWIVAGGSVYRAPQKDMRTCGYCGRAYYPEESPVEGFCLLCSEKGPTALKLQAAIDNYPMRE